MDVVAWSTNPCTSIKVDWWYQAVSVTLSDIKPGHYEHCHSHSVVSQHYWIWLSNPSILWWIYLCPYLQNLVENSSSVNWPLQSFGIMSVHTAYSTSKIVIQSDMTSFFIDAFWCEILSWRMLALSLSHQSFWISVSRESSGMAHCVHMSTRISEYIYTTPR